MDRNGRVATWLELAVAPEWRRKTMNVCVHPIGARDDQCFAISMDGRHLCASNGQLTTFRGRPAVERFLHIVQIDSFNLAEPDPGMNSFPRGYFCLCLNRQNNLGPCAEQLDGDTPTCSPTCGLGQTEWHPAASGSDRGRTGRGVPHRGTV
ncbi:MAG: hypothetical protein PHG21_01215 [Azoarcus sp.]|nr:hypothetical protein [Azoarcus sp.]